jgi:hypothetical protein
VIVPVVELVPVVEFVPVVELVPVPVVELGYELEAATPQEPSEAVETVDEEPERAGPDRLQERLRSQYRGPGGGSGARARSRRRDRRHTGSYAYTSAAMSYRRSAPGTDL